MYLYWLYRHIGRAEAGKMVRPVPVLCRGWWAISRYKPQSPAFTRSLGIGACVAGLAVFPSKQGMSEDPTYHKSRLPLDNTSAIVTLFSILFQFGHRKIFEIFLSVESSLCGETHTVSDTVRFLRIFPSVESSLCGETHTVSDTVRFLRIFLSVESSLCGETYSSGLETTVFAGPPSPRTYLRSFQVHRLQGH